MPDYTRPRHGRPINRHAAANIPPLPTDTLRSLSPACPHHSHPLAMRMAGETTSACGETLVLYACDDVRCRYREGWRLDLATGQPFRAVHGFDQSRN